MDNGYRIINANSNNYDRGRFLREKLWFVLELLSRGMRYLLVKLTKGEVDFVAYEK